jgi:hypothetical protein
MPVRHKNSLAAYNYDPFIASVGEQRSVTAVTIAAHRINGNSAHVRTVNIAQAVTQKQNGLRRTYLSL